MVRGFFDRHPIDMLVGAVMALCFAYQFTVLLPHAGIGWQAHIGGPGGGVPAGGVFRDRRGAGRARPRPPAAAAPAPGKAVPPAAGTAHPYSGPRADLHKQLDDLDL